jgi:hypothetical protein
MRLIFLFISLISLNSWAWNVDVKKIDGNEVYEIIVSNNDKLNNIKPYLTWVDIDAEDVNEIFHSWTVKNGWQNDLTPAFGKNYDMPKIQNYHLTNINRSCPTEHRCFLAMIAVLPDDNPLNSNHWLASSIYPLSIEAAAERLPGQQFFSEQINRGYIDETDGIVLSESMPEVAPTVPQESVAVEKNGNTNVNTEKPDIFKLVDKQLLYANNKAKMFQIIDVKDKNKPYIVAQTKLTGNPLEIYVINEYYILMQTKDYNKTIMTVFSIIDNKLQQMQEIDVAGNFIESRRRDNVIYTVSRDNTEYEPYKYCLGCGNPIGLIIRAIELDKYGQLNAIAKTEIQGYSPEVSIYSDYLIITSGNPQQWPNSLVQTFDLSNSAKPLNALINLEVAGKIPSEFHVNVKNEQLRVVYGPEDRQAGSTLAIYDLQTEKLDLIGKVDEIAAGEDLFATRFVDDKAYIVTYERTDPLWVIDLSIPENPTILGELEVPGWSEKLFFHDDLLFAVGIDDTSENSNWSRLVAVSLFDVADPTDPKLINRLTPMENDFDNEKYKTSYSPALDDERALLLDWKNEFAALPIDAYGENSTNSLQIVSLSNRELNDVGLLSVPISLQRSLSLDDNTLIALADQSLFTLDWGKNIDPKIIAELELSRNLKWVRKWQDNLLVAAIGDSGYNRLYIYSEDLEELSQQWKLDKDYREILYDDNKVVFYNSYYSYLELRILNLNNGVLSANIKLDAEGYKYGYTALLNNNKFYVVENVSLSKFNNVFKNNPQITENLLNNGKILHNWAINDNGVTKLKSISIPGEPVAFNQNGDLITTELNYHDYYNLSLNLLSVNNDKAKLLSSKKLDCDGGNYQFYTQDAIYSTCYKYDYSDNIVGENIQTKSSIAPHNYVPNNVTTEITKYSFSQGLIKQGFWKFDKLVQLKAVMNNTISLAIDYDDYGYNPTCEIHQLNTDGQTNLLQKIDNCSGNSDMLLIDSRAIFTLGFEGLEAISW